MGSAALLDQVWALLANDTTFLGFKSLTPASDGASKAAYIVKEEETDNIVTGSTIPIVLVYTRPGHADARTIQAYTAKVVIDCFAVDGNTARKMVDQTHALMHNWKPPNVSAYLCRSAYDTSFKTGISGVKGHRKFFDVLTYVG
jgi:hypothetical protein